MKSGKKIFNKIILVVFLITIDQYTKYFFINYLKNTANFSIQICEYFDIVYVWNYGISFGLFFQYYQYSNMLFCFLSTLIIMYVLYLLKNTKNLLTQIGLILVFSGGFSNIIDRILRGAVFDFISLHYTKYYFPVFNLADSFITLGIIILLFTLHKNDKKIES